MNETNANLTDETLSDATHVEAADGGAAVANADTLSLTELNQILGKNFPDKAAALKSVKDTFSYVGRKAPEPQAPAADESWKTEVQSLKNDLYFAAHPELTDYRSLIEKMGSNPAEVAEMPEFKTIFEKAKVADEVEQKKSVVHSSPRIAQDKNAMDTAVQLVNAGRNTEEIADVLAKNLNESLGMD